MATNRTSLMLLQAPAPPRRPTNSVAPLQKHTVFTVQAASSRTQAWGAPDKPPSSSEATAIRPEQPSRPLFDGLQPLVYTGAALGIFPISFRPLRVCFHPTRSTLLYALVLQMYAVWSIVVVDGTIVSQNADAATSRFWNAHSIVHLAGFLIAPVFWAESRCIAQLRTSCDNLMVDFGYLLWGHSHPPGHQSATPGAPGVAGAPGAPGAPRPRRRSRHPQRAVVWFATAAMWTVSPALYIAWVTFVQTRRTDDESGIVHILVNTYLGYGVATTSICCLRLRTFATALLSALRRELADPDLTPQRVLEYRRTWTYLTYLSSGFIVTPVSMLLVTVMLVILVTLHTYEAVERVTAGAVEVALAIWIIGVPFFVMLFILCEVPHRSADVIRSQFMNVLQMSYCRYRNDRSYNELHRFLEIVWWNSPVTTISGYFELKRSSFKAIVTVAVTYVIVILQFHLSINNSTELNRLNSTLNKVDVT